MSEMRSMQLQAWEKVGELTAEKIQLVREDVVRGLLQATIFLNDDTTEYGYACINGEPIPDKLLRIISLHPNMPHEIVLTSDGYPQVKQSLAEAEQCLMDVCRTDPHCYKIYKSTKGIQDGCTSFDDRAYIKFFTE